MKARVLGLAAVGMLVGATPALAHHSFAMFDRDKQVSLTGTVHDFQWTNPHAWIEIDVPDGKGGADKWGVELNSPNNLSRQGWRSNLLHPGDKVTIVLNPLRSGEHGGLFLQATLPDGRVLGDKFLSKSAAPAAASPAK
ncbi:MAG: DUF6152 family protein [Caulobacteraceae bacterium]